MSTLEHFFKSTSDAGSSSTSIRLSGSPEEIGESRVCWKEAGQLCDNFGGVKAKVAKYAAENGVSASLRHFKAHKSWIRAIREIKRQALARWQ